MLTQRISISAVCGYSSLSIMFLSKDSVSSRTASGSIHVVTKVARFIRAFPSSISSSWIVSYATLAGTSCGPSRCRGIDSPPRSNNGSTDSSVVRGCRPAGCFRGTGALLRLATGCEGARASRTVRGHPPPGLAPRQAAGLAPDRLWLREPDAHPASRLFKEALVADGIPFTSFGVDDARAEHARLVALGVRFTQEPLEIGPVVTAVLDDTCGHLIQI